MSTATTITSPPLPPPPPASNFHSSSTLLPQRPPKKTATKLVIVFWFLFFLLLLVSGLSSREPQSEPAQTRNRTVVSPKVRIMQKSPGMSSDCITGVLVFMVRSLGLRV